MAVTIPHILVFSLAYDPYIGGAEIALREIMRRLPQFHFTVITARALKNFPHQALDEIEESGNVRVVRVGSTNRWCGQYGYPFFAVRRAFMEARFQRPAAVWGMMESYGGMAASLFCQKFSDIPYLLTMQSGDSDAFWQWRTWFWKPAYRRVFSHAAMIQAISHFLAKRARQMGARGQIEVIPNGVDLEKFSKSISSQDRMEIRRQWGVGNDAWVVFTASRLVWKNGIDILIRGYAAWRRKQTSRKARLVIAGDGPLERSLRALAAREGVEREVVCMPHIRHEELPRYYQSSDIFVRPSRSEGLGIAFLEAMASGLPIIGTPVGGIVDFLKDGETGIVVSPNDADGVADAIERFVDDATLRARLIENGKGVARAGYSWDSIASEMGVLLDRIMRTQHV